MLFRDLILLLFFIIIIFIIRFINEDFFNLIELILLLTVLGLANCSKLSVFADVINNDFSMFGDINFKVGVKIFEIEAD